ncbi:hypothetical protein FRZ00_04305 [Streptomyces mobaraensis]|uniref:Uncharacterized protein n=1 Tax=Streptomyces mobaraensis TaxID=35621 RepID=A0A5N5WD64_STRMB|nr:hypothetical protein FRZ00_04305 [Streptomyces mobaraensis]
MPRSRPFAASWGCAPDPLFRGFAARPQTPDGLDFAPGRTLQPVRRLRTTARSAVSGGAGACPRKKR